MDSPTSVQANWNPPNSGSSVVDGFEVSYNSGNGPLNMRPLLDSNAVSDVIPSLFPGSTYNVFVATVAGTGSFQESSDLVPVNGIQCNTGKL